MRLKLGFFILFFIAGILIISSLVFYFYFKGNLIDDLELRLADSADKIILEIAQNPDTFLAEPSSFLYSATPSEFTASGMLVQFMDREGKFMARSHGLRRTSLPFAPGRDDIISDVEINGKTELKVYQRKIELEGDLYGYVIVGAPLSQIYGTLEILREVLFVVMVSVLIILALGINAIALINMASNQKRFLSFASHELRTPLSVISGNAEVALLKDLTREQYKEALKTIKDESDWMNKLVGNLLMVFRGETGAEKKKKTKFNLGELVAEEAASMQKRYPGKKTMLSLPEDAEVQGDEDRLRQVVKNILENAAKYTTDDGSIEIKLTSSARRVALEVKDNGVGIKRELQKKIFDPFFRIEDKKSQGMGLGLAISRWIIASHGGSIKVISVPEKGSVFIVSLPR